MSLRVLAPTVVGLSDGRWRMYFESRGPAREPAVICSAVSSDMLSWELEEGVRIRALSGVGAPRHVRAPDDTVRLYCTATGSTHAGSGPPTRVPLGVVSARTTDDIDFTLERGIRLPARQCDYDSAGITAAEPVPPEVAGGQWMMVFSAWQDVPPGTNVPLHPSLDAAAVAEGGSESFAEASIASDMAGYRSRIYVAMSRDGLSWERGDCILEGAGYGAEGIDAVHAEDMSLIRIGDGRYRMYYAACDAHGGWRIASAVGHLR